MLEKLITNLKKSLPESIQKKLGMVDENEETTEEEGAEASEESEVEESEESEEGASSSDDEKKKKQKSMIVRVVVILALAYLAADHFLLKEDGDQSNSGEASVDDVLARAEAKRKAKNKKSKEDLSAGATKDGAGQETTSAKPPEVASAEPGMPASEVSETAPTAPAENVNILEKTETPAPPTAEVVPESAPVTPVGSEEVSAPVAETPKTEEKVVGESKESPSMSEGGLDQKIDQLIDKVEGAAGENPLKDEAKKSSMTDKIVEELTYSAPPNYEQIGRGLVYNCVEKHWACVDKLAYVACNKNMKWNSAKEKASECVVHNVYSTDEDCAKVQKYNVTTNQPTTFCK